MARQHRPRARTTQAADAVAVVDGYQVRVGETAVSGWAQAVARPGSGAAELEREASVRDLRSQIGIAGLRRAAADAGRTPPSDRTLRRWIHNNRIPHPQVAELAQRRGLVHRQGGVLKVADAIGADPSTVSRYQTGKTKELRGPARRDLADLRATDILSRGGMVTPDGKPKRASVVVVGDVMARSGGEAGYDYRTNKTFDFDGVGAPMDARDSRDLAAAVARGDHAAAIAIVERHASVNFANFESFDNTEGFHFESISSINIDWH